MQHFRKERTSSCPQVGSCLIGNRWLLNFLQICQTAPIITWQLNRLISTLQCLNSSTSSQEAQNTILNRFLWEASSSRAKKLFLIALLMEVSDTRATSQLIQGSTTRDLRTLQSILLFLLRIPSIVRLILGSLCQCLTLKSSNFQNLKWKK